MLGMLPCYNMDTMLTGKTGNFILKIAANGFVAERAGIIPEFLASVRKSGYPLYPKCFLL